MLAAKEPVTATGKGAPLATLFKKYSTRVRHVRPFRVDYTTIIDIVDNYLTDLAQAIAQ